MSPKILVIIIFMSSYFGFGQDLDIYQKKIDEEKRTRIDSLKALYQSDTANEQLLISIIEEYKSIDEDSIALFYSDRLLKISEDTGDVNKIAKRKLNQVEILLRLNQIEVAMKLISEILDDKSRIDSETLVETNSTLASYYASTGDFEASIKYAKENEAICLKLNDSVGLTFVYSSIAISYTHLERTEEGIGYFEKANQYRGKKQPYNSAAIMLNISMLYGKISNFDNALEKVKEAEKFAIKNDVSEIFPHIYKTYATIYYARKEYNESLEYSLKALDLAKDKNLSGKGLGSIYKYIGNNYYMLENYEAAVYNLEKFVALDVHDVSIFDADRAEEYLIIDAYQKTGNYERAFVTLSKFHRIKDSVSRTDQSSKLTEIVEKYENEKKAIEIDNLHITNEMQAAKLDKQALLIFGVLSFVLLLAAGALIFYKNYQNRQKLIVAEQDLDNAVLKQRLLRTQLNPHFFFHALSSIEHYIHKGEKTQASKFLIDFSHLMRTILESSDVDFITLDEDIDFIKKYFALQQLSQNFTFNYDLFIEPNLKTKHILVPPMLIQPFVENAVLHGASNSLKTGLVRISYTASAGHLIIEITDNGQSRASTSSQSSKLTRSMSTEIVKQRIENLKKKDGIDIQYTVLQNTKAELGGTQVIFQIPLRYGAF